MLFASGVFYGQTPACLHKRLIILCQISMLVVL